MKNISAIVLICILLAYGLIRLGVGAALIAQSEGIVQFSELNEAVTEVGDFIKEHGKKSIIPFGVTGYFWYIFLMGGLLSTGATGAILRKKWGFIFLWIYIAFHASLFINFQVINPKIFVLIIQSVMIAIISYLRPGLN